MSTEKTYVERKVVSSTSSILIQKATKADIAELEAYTIDCMDESLYL